MLPHPKNGLNSGVMLMNLENMRNQNWNDKMLTMFEELQSFMAFCDQDIVNVYSYYYPTELELSHGIRTVTLLSQLQARFLSQQPIKFLLN